VRKPAAQHRLPFSLDADIDELYELIANVEMRQQNYPIGPDWRRYQMELLRLGDKLRQLKMALDSNQGEC
jgi:hypothetical protein